MTRFLLDDAPTATPRCRTRDRTRFARYIGRVGALAVALGIGVAAPGVAGAEPDTTSPTPESASTQQSSTDTESVEQQTTSAPAAAEATETPTTATTAAANDSASGSSPETSLDPRDGIVQASGGANTTVTASDGTTTTSRSTVDDTKSAHDSVARIQPTSTLSADTVSIAQSAPEPTPRVTTTTALVSPSPMPAPRVAVRVDPVTAVVHRVVSLAHGLAAMVGLSPTLTSAPLTPVEPPTLWVMLAWVRRQFEDALFGESPAVGFGAITTSQSESGVVTGTISATDPDKDPLAVRVIEGPNNGTVAVDPGTGEFIYTPNEALARSGGIDTFTVAVTESGTDAPRDFVAAILGVNRRNTGARVLVSVLPLGADPAGDTLDAAKLLRLVAGGKAAISTNADGSIRTINGTFTDTAVRTNADAAQTMNGIARLLGADPGFADESNITSQGLRFIDGGEPTEVMYRLQPTVNGIPTLASQVVLVTDGRGTVTGVFSSYHQGINDVDTTSSTNFGEGTAAETAVLAALYQRLTEQGADAAAVLAAVATKSDLVIYDVDPDVAPTLACRVTVYSTVIPTDADGALPVVSTTYYMYANGLRAGDILAAFSNATDASTAWVTSTKTTTDLKAKSRTITGQYQASSGSWRFNDVARNVSTYSASSTSSAPGTMVKKTWWTSWNRSAVSAHANTAVVYDYYQNTLGRLAYDGLGSSLRVSVLPNSYSNAYWDPGLKILVFGHDFEAALDVVGHEFTHGVVNYAVANGGGLIYQNESGALNESYADILGSLIENKTGSARWLIAEDYRCGKTSCAIRDMSDPSRYGQPENYANRYTGTADYGGVHKNSGIFNFAAYKMMTDSRTSTVSSATWAAVFYGSLYKLSSNATFADGRAAVLNTANSLGFTATAQQAITDAFNAVGIS